MRKSYIKPEILKIVEIHGNAHLCEVYATVPDMKGEMNCDCGGDASQCTCGETCDCWGCGGWDVKAQRNSWSEGW